FFFNTQPPTALYTLSLHDALPILESRIPDSGRLRFVEVKGRVAGARTITVTKNEILTALNKPEEFFLAVVEVDGDTAGEPTYLRSEERRVGKEWRSRWWADR